MFEGLEKQIWNIFSFSPNKNQLNEIKRLIFEITRRENIPSEAILEYLKNNPEISKYAGRNIFFGLKNALIKRRFPITSAKEKIDTKKVFLNKLSLPFLNNWRADKDFKPEVLFIEKKITNSHLLEKFKNFYPNIKIEELNFYSEYIKKNKFSLEELKRPLIFIIEEKNDFLKLCPCTKAHIGCGYWILNISFGCPYDCSYCFLQSYSNFPGIILADNIDDFFYQFDKLYKKLKKPIRIGTGEFSDSLALDNITGYSKILIKYFRNKDVLFELKTKSNNIKNLLDTEPSKNIVISWSLNPNILIETEEIATASLEERISSAKILQQMGYSVAFHFDPIIHINNWQKLYEEVIDKLYLNLKPPFSWISLGTLRSNRMLKTIVEKRFPQSNIFYGELFLGEDKKLRYPKFLRKEIYKNILNLIKKYDTNTPIYLCMEDKEVWQIINKKLLSSLDIEKYLLKQYF